MRRHGSLTGVRGFSLIEILLALTLLLITITVIGSGLVGTLQLERQTEAQLATEPIAEWVTARHAAGIFPENIAQELEEQFPDAVVSFDNRKAADESIWNHWSLQSSEEAPSMTLDLIALPSE